MARVIDARACSSAGVGLQLQMELQKPMHMPVLSPARRSEAVRRFGEKHCLGVAVVCLLVLAGWLFDVPVLRSGVPDGPTMKISTALAVMLTAASLLAALMERRPAWLPWHPRLRLFSLAAATVVVVFCGLVLVEFFWRRDAASSEAPPLSWLQAVTRRPSVASALSLALAGLSLLIWRRPRGRRIFPVINGCVFLIPWLGFAGLILGVRESTRSLFFGHLSLPASVALMALGAGLFCLRPMEGLARLFSSQNHAGRLVRWLMPAGALLTPALGRLVLWAQDHWHFSSAFVTALYGSAMFLVLAFVSLQGTWILLRFEQSQHRAETKMARELGARREAVLRLEQSEARLAAGEQRFRGIFNSTFNFIGLLAPDGTLLEANQTALDLIGAAPAAVLGLPFAETPWWTHSKAEQDKLKNGITRAALGETVRFETSHRDGSGGVRFVDFTLKPVIDSAGNVIHLVPEGRDVTEQKLATQALETSAEEFRTLTEAMPQIVWMTRADGWNIYFNQQWMDYTGLSLEESLGHGWNKPFHPEDQQHAWDAWQAATTKLTPYVLESRLRRADGAYRWWLIRGEPLRDAAGNVFKWLGTCTDIHDLKLAEEQRQLAVQQIAASEELLRQFIKHTPAAIAMLDTQMRYVQTSDRWLKDYRLDAQAIIGRSHYEIFPDIPQRWRDIHQRVLAGAVESCDEDLFPRAGGGQEWLQWEARPWHNAHGEIGGVVFYTQVITARKEAEFQMRESEERFRGAFENAPIGMAMVSLEGRWMRVNRAICRLVGRSEEELLASTFQDITHPDDLDADLEQVRALIRGESDHFTMEKRYFHKSGRIVWVLLAVTIVRRADGAPLHFVSQIEDITASHETAQRMRASLEEKEVLLREIHHRVKNNLQVISSLLQLQSGYLNDPQDVAMFRECQARIHAMGLVHDRLYRSDNLSTIDFSEHLRELVSLIVRGQSGGMENIRVVIQSDAVEVSLDTAIPLGLITAELVTNAFKHAFTGRQRGVITVSLARASSQGLELAVEDDGVGLPAAFDPARARSLGLRLIRALAGQLRADFSITSPGAGCRARLAVPAEKHLTTNT